MVFGAVQQNAVLKDSDGLVPLHISMLEMYSDILQCLRGSSQPEAGWSKTFLHLQRFLLVSCETCSGLEASYKRQQDPRRPLPPRKKVRNLHGTSPPPGCLRQELKLGFFGNENFRSQVSSPTVSFHPWI